MKNPVVDRVLAELGASEAKEVEVWKASVASPRELTDEERARGDHKRSHVARYRRKDIAVTADQAAALLAAGAHDGARGIP